MVFYYLLMGIVVMLLIHTVRRVNANSGDTRINEEEARVILGVGPNATEEEIREAHKRLIQKNHPDQGGSAFLATQINVAKDVLLKGKK